MEQSQRKPASRSVYVVLILLCLLFAHNAVVYYLDGAWAYAGVALSGLLMVLPTPATVRLMSSRLQDGARWPWPVQHRLALLLLGASVLFKSFG